MKSERDLFGGTILRFGKLLGIATKMTEKINALLPVKGEVLLKNPCNRKSSHINNPCKEESAMPLERDTVMRFLSENMLYLRDSFHVSRIGLFGSFARNEPSEKSDVDIVVEFEAGTPDLYGVKQELRQYLEKQFHRDVDICREKYIKPFARDLILKETMYVK